MVMRQADRRDTDIAPDFDHVNHVQRLNPVMEVSKVLIIQHDDKAVVLHSNGQDESGTGLEGEEESFPFLMTPAVSLIRVADHYSLLIPGIDLQCDFDRHALPQLDAKAVKSHARLARHDDLVPRFDPSHDPVLKRHSRVIENLWIIVLKDWTVYYWREE